MTGKDRFYRTIERRTTDYPASWLGKPTDEALPGLLSYFESEDEGDLKAAIGDDIFTIDVPYHTRTSSKITTALDFRKGPADGDYKRESLTAAGFFEDYHSLKDVDRFPWPDPAKGLDTEEAKRRALSAPQDSAVMALLWSCHFQDSCSAFGMEQAFIRLMLEPELFKAVIGKITEFYLEANRIFYQTVSKHLDAVLIGNDFGSQQGLMVFTRSFTNICFSRDKAVN